MADLARLKPGGRRETEFLQSVIDLSSDIEQMYKQFLDLEEGDTKGRQLATTALLVCIAVRHAATALLQDAELPAERLRKMYRNLVTITTGLVRRQDPRRNGRKMDVLTGISLKLTEADELVRNVEVVRGT